MKTITNLELYYMALYSLMEKTQREEERNEEFKKTYDRDNNISIHHIKKYNEQMEELHAEILKLENEK